MAIEVRWSVSLSGSTVVRWMWTPGYAAGRVVAFEWNRIAMVLWPVFRGSVLVEVDRLVTVGFERGSAGRR
ncbi:hypothetical protein [Nocardia sp. NPDC050793]|uniref:hypothetical protein n=1 Tax=Nocardia sp. NPDC050793 TaxID=3155159 RepID=UPI00340AD028